MKSWKKPTNEMIDKALGSLKKVTTRKYFFSRLENPLWLKPLAERGYFKYPPKSQRFDDGTIQFPYWPEIQYLKNVCSELPDAVVNLVMDLPEIDNPIVYDGIVDIALHIPGKQSAKLKDQILKYAGMEHQLGSHKYAGLLAHWTAKNQISAALELSKVLVAFAPDPQSEEKQKLRKENPMDSNTLLEPSPRMTPRDYREIMLKGIRPLAESEPYDVVRLLIDATVNMIYLRRHKQDFNNEEDNSWSWCPCLYKPGKDGGSSEETLIHTLTFACEKVFEKPHNAIIDLDETLRDQHWKIFKRLRHHLYAQYPNEQTKPWILELILTLEYYNRWNHSYEFQLMIRRACEHFGETLLTEEERTQIFDAILAGPSKTDYQRRVVEFWGIEFNDEGFLQYKLHRHRIQLTPFAPVLFGKYETYLQELETEGTSRIFDEDYIPSKTEVREVPVSKRSPYSHQELAKLTDDNLLNFINAWDDEDKFHENEDYVEINIEALASAFQTVFKESIIPDPVRFKFWMENRERIERPIYVRMMIYAMQTHVKTKNFDKLKEWLAFSEWVLSHPDQEHSTDYRSGDKTRENRNWSNARRAVSDFIGVCFEKEVDVPITVRGQLTTLLEMLCLQFDWRLDKNKPTVLNQYDPLTEGINNTRSLALQELITFGLWLQAHHSESEVSEVTTILERRFSQETKYPLTLPEYAILGKNYLSIYSLNEKWATDHKSDFFPQKKRPEWVAAFSNFVLCNRAVKPIFKILRDDFNFALQHLFDFKNRDRGGHEPIDVLGERLFNYYLWEMFPLNGQASLLEQFYQRTDKKREHWANLFDDIGHRLWNSGKNLNQNMKDKILAFFKWRFEQEEPTELKHFTFWLEAECLDVEWRLESYSKILDVCMVEGAEIRLKTLCDMLPDHTAKVIECFFKLTKWSKEDNLYIRAEEAKTLLKAGRESRTERVQQNAAQAHENLLREGRFDLLDLDD